MSSERARGKPRGARGGAGARRARELSITHYAVLPLSVGAQHRLCKCRCLGAGCARLGKALGSVAPRASLERPPMG
eukprot:2286148-Pyramimonas_sp.AAC.1